eukprot:gene31839-7045_t
MFLPLQPYTSNIYVRRVLSGEFTVVNQHLLHDLNRLGLWCPDIKNELGGPRAAADAIKFTVDQNALKVNKQKNSTNPGSVTKAARTAPDLTPKQNKTVDADMEREAAMAAMVCSLENKDECLMCGS